MEADTKHSFSRAADFPSDKEMAVRAAESTMEAYLSIALSGAWSREHAVFFIKEMRDLIRAIDKVPGRTKGCIVERLRPVALSMNSLREAFRISGAEVEAARLPYMHHTGRPTALPVFGQG